MSLRRNMKNSMRKYSPAECDVREATSNDDMAPSPALLAQCGAWAKDLTRLPGMMAIIWKRLDDSGKLWRHPYKCLILLEYLLKQDNFAVADELRHNVFAIQSLIEFQFVDKNGMDQGLNVRERAKSVLQLMEDLETRNGAFVSMPGSAGGRHMSHSSDARGRPPPPHMQPPSPPRDECATPPPGEDSLPPPLSIYNFGDAFPSDQYGDSEDGSVAINPRFSDPRTPPPGQAWGGASNGTGLAPGSLAYSARPRAATATERPTLPQRRSSSTAGSSAAASANGIRTASRDPVIAAQRQQHVLQQQQMARDQGNPQSEEAMLRLAMELSSQEALRDRELRQREEDELKEALRISEMQLSEQPAAAGPDTGGLPPYSFEAGQGAAGSGAATPAHWAQFS